MIKNIKRKIIFSALGLAIILAGFNAKSQNLTQVIIGILMLTGAGLLFTSLPLKQLFDNKVTSKDVSIIISLVLIVIIVVSAILVLSNVAIWSWLTPYTFLALIIVGTMTLFNGWR